MKAVPSGRNRPGRAVPGAARAFAGVPVRKSLLSQIEFTGGLYHAYTDATCQDLYFL